MKIEYDSAKEQANIEKHGVSLERFVDLDWGTATVRPDTKKDYGEVRYVGMGELDGRLHVTCFTLRNDVFRVINLRKANTREQRDYYGN